jgi:mRNA interferase HigB
MRIIPKSTLCAFWEDHPEAEEPLLAWFREVEKAEWSRFSDIKQQYRSACGIGGNVIFNVGGNRYCLAAKVNYPYRVVFIRTVEIEAEYEGVALEEGVA